MGDFFYYIEGTLKIFLSGYKCVNIFCFKRNCLIDSNEPKALVSNGITLYGKFKSNIKGKYKTLFVWENVKPNSKRVLFNKQMVGYKYENKFYSGLLQKYEGERLGKGCILVDLEYYIQFHELFKKYKIPVKIKKYWNTNLNSFSLFSFYIINY